MNKDLKKNLENIWKEFKKSKQDPIRLGFLGQPGAGKSSLINTIIGQQVAPVGVETDYSRGAVAYPWNEMSMVDLPGYGTERFPREGFVERFGLLEFDALLCIASGKFRSDDLVLFRIVMEHKRPCVFVRTYTNSLSQPGKTKEELKKLIHKDLKENLRYSEFNLVFVDNSTQEGLADLQDLLVGLIAPARRGKYYRWAQGTSDTFLKKKRESCNNLILWYSAGAAANGLNPIPGTDIAIDLAIVGKMYVDILSSFGYTREILEDYIHKYEMLKPVIMPLINTILRGAIALSAAFAGSAAAKWLPFAGPVITASAGAAIVFASGHSFADQCLQVSYSVRDAELNASTIALV